MKYSALALSGVFLLSACTWFNSADSNRQSDWDQLSAETRNTLVVCGGGYRKSIGAKLEAKIGKTLEAGGKIDGELYNGVRSAFLSDASVDNEPASKAFIAYVDCVNKMSEK